MDHWESPATSKPLRGANRVPAALSPYAIISIKAAAILDCSYPRAAPCTAAACAAGAHSSRRTSPSPASSAAGHRLSGEAASHHPARPWHRSLVFAIISPARFFSPPKRTVAEVVACCTYGRLRILHSVKTFWVTQLLNGLELRDQTSHVSETLRGMW